MTLETFRFLSCLTGAAASGLLAWRFIGRWSRMMWLDRIIVGCLSAAVLIFGFGAARQATLHAPFNEFSVAAFVVELIVMLACLFWPKLLIPEHRRRNSDHPDQPPAG